DNKFGQLQAPPQLEPVAKAEQRPRLSTLEMMMSTLALRAAGVIASAVQPEPGQSFVERLLAAREAEAKRRVRWLLAAMDDARLAGLGFSPKDVAALRDGKLR